MTEVKSGTKKFAKWFSVIVLSGSLLMVGATLVSNNTIKSINNSRNTQLEAYELTSQWVQEDVRNYLSVNDEKSYSDAKRNAHMSKELMQTLYGSSYDDTKATGVKSVSLVDAQYSFKESDGTTVFYILANVAKDDSKKAVNVMVFVKDNKIYDMLAY